MVAGLKGLATIALAGTHPPQMKKDLRRTSSGKLPRSVRSKSARPAGHRSPNQNKDREPYSLTGNNCGTFMKDVLEAGGHDTPWMIDPRPNSYIQELRSSSDTTVDYLPKNNLLKVDRKDDK